jgi:hypothetical protein
MGLGCKMKNLATLMRSPISTSLVLAIIALTVASCSYLPLLSGDEQYHMVTIANRSPLDLSFVVVEYGDETFPTRNLRGTRPGLADAVFGGSGPNKIPRNMYVAWVTPDGNKHSVTVPLDRYRQGTKGIGSVDVKWVGATAQLEVSQDWEKSSYQYDGTLESLRYAYERVRIYPR